MTHLIINPDQPVSNLQQQFSDAFPFLKIECFKSEHQYSEGSAKKKIYSPETYLGSCMPEHKFGSISINREMKVSQLEQHFKKEFGLNIQVFRKSGKVWLETTATDSWTLQQQNDEGRLSTRAIKEEIESADDHDVY